MSKTGLISQTNHHGFDLFTIALLKVMDRLTPGYSWPSGWLHDNVAKDRTPKAFGTGYQIMYLGQPGGKGSQHQWNIQGINKQYQVNLAEAVRLAQSGSKTAIAVSQNGFQASQPLGDVEEDILWNSLVFRSPAELKIAEVLEARGLLFFANARGRVLNRLGVTETREPDLLVIYRGEVRILEVDGREFHPSAAEDHKRDRTFERHGIRTYRFTAAECMKDPESVVDEFLELWEVTHHFVETTKKSSSRGASDQKIQFKGISSQMRSLNGGEDLEF